ncbi:hypothetical protein [Novipirellula artificiosorum]|uniref:DUF4350 domain-containing protein n=1 Tax=Novipirellula artificiosorum TaxID=2528016 RepID=A0A5C6DUU3_9BACT|nr:hypothetical protein [Novipirellula artificiosorum]TWU40428.1 hypothetical protein Poly41_12600 [Novipirellula artificiosorum]
MNSAKLIVCLVILVAAAGCNRLSTEYGHSSGVQGRQSLNGFGALRETFVQAGLNDRDIRRLTQRVERCDIIVWTPEYLTSIQSDATRWFDRWLRRGGHTLVFVIPDSGSETDYWLQASRLASAEQRLEYRRRAARSINQRMQWRLNRTTMPTNGWFVSEPLVQRRGFSKTDGPWARGALSQLEGETKKEIEFRLKPFVREDPQASGATSTATVPIPANTSDLGPTGPGSPTYLFPGAATPTSTDVDFVSLVQSESGLPIVAKIESAKWKDSKIIVIAGGSLVTNFAMTDPFSAALTAKIVQSSLASNPPDGRVGFISAAPTSLPVSEPDASVPKASGMELLTTWPISLVTIHAVLLGLVICLMLLPSLGRPKRVRYSVQGDFGDHLDAVASLMNRAGGEDYARSRIREYMRQIHGETTVSATATKQDTMAPQVTYNTSTDHSDPRTKP